MSNKKKLVGKVYLNEENNCITYEKNQEDDEFEGVFEDHDEFKCNYCNGIIEWEYVSDDNEEATKRFEENGHIYGFCTQCCSGGYLSYPIWSIYNAGDMNDYTDDEDEIPMCEGKCIIHRKEITS